MQQGIGFRYFLLSFSIAFLAFSLLFMGFMTLYHPKTAVAAAPPEIEETYAPVAEDAITVLFMGTADRDSVPGMFLLARFDPAAGKIPLALFPPQTAVANNGQMETLTEVYRYGGAKYTAEALATTLGVGIDRYVRMEYSAFLAAADMVGNVEFDLERETTIRQDGASLVLGAGKQLLDGQKAGAILRSEEGGEDEALERAGRLMAEIVNQRIDIAPTIVADTLFESVINIVDTNISYPDYHDRKESAIYLAKTIENPAYVVPLSGNWDEESALFALSDTFLAQVASEIG